MKKITALILGMLAMAACSDDKEEPAAPELPPVDKPKWHLEWSDDFNGDRLDESAWSRTDRGTPDWQNTQSKDDRCYEMTGSSIKLKGIVNPDTSADPSPYLTGGIWSKGKKAFGPSEADASPVCIQVKARLDNGAAGAWPAIWMMPFAEDQGWPECGEIDIMERLNHDNAVYQTLHSHYSYTLGKKDPVNSILKRVAVSSDYHIYEVQLWPERVRFYIDGVESLTYPKVNGGADDQFPYFKEWYLIIDMQLGGSWVGNVDPSQLPVEMEVDWVRCYRYY